jgi:hypothetical protein
MAYDLSHALHDGPRGELAILFRALTGIEQLPGKVPSLLTTHVYRISRSRDTNCLHRCSIGARRDPIIGAKNGMRGTGINLPEQLKQIIPRHAESGLEFTVINCDPIADCIHRVAYADQFVFGEPY